MKDLSVYSLREILDCLNFGGIKIKSGEEFKNTEDYNNYLNNTLRKNIENNICPPIEKCTYRSVNSTRFGLIEGEILMFKEGVLGFESYRSWILMNPSDSTDILWLQSFDDGEIAFPLYSSSKLEIPGIIPSSDTFYILSIPFDITKMTANTKAPILISNNMGGQFMAEKGVCNYPVYNALKKNVMNN